MKNLPNYAVDYVLGGHTLVLVLPAEDRDDAFDRARRALVDARFYGASIQGTARVATQADIDSAHQECSICRRRHGHEVQHACE